MASLQQMLKIVVAHIFLSELLFLYYIIL
uniref:Uncharacterized protein n=1 Tax=Anguilla anguilla TaxID=7936 RepID=A0A0E9WRD1_ANGAN